MLWWDSRVALLCCPALQISGHFSWYQLLRVLASLSLAYFHHYGKLRFMYLPFYVSEPLRYSFSPHLKASIPSFQPPYRPQVT